MNQVPNSKTTNDRTTPLGLLRYASEYYAGAEATDDAIGDDRGHERHAPMVVNFLIGQAAELALKAYLLHTGLTVDELRSRNFGHDLIALFDAAMNNGFGKDVSIGNKEREMLALLNGYYKDRELQYFKGGMKEAFPVYGPLQEAVAAVLRAAIARVPGAEGLRGRKATEALFR